MGVLYSRSHMADRNDNCEFTDRVSETEADDRVRERQRLAEDIAWLVLRWLRRPPPDIPPRTDERPAVED
jgi:hypothetical protein